ncbi:MAG: hypothetical protein ACKO5R_08445 [Planctomycetaceae bacterium]
MHGGAGEAAAASYGFLTTVDSATHGVFGGYLVIDVTGRPLEFHCTTPVKVSRAQRILYGATLPAQLHGRQIGATLLADTTTRPLAVLTDDEALLHVRPHTPLPVVLVRPRDGAAPCRGEGLTTFGEAALLLPDTAPADLVDRLGALAAGVDLREPFERIRAAIDEAQKH